MPVFKQKRPNGDVYVYSYDSFYDPATKRTGKINKKLIGKISPETGEMIPTGKVGRPKGSTNKKIENDLKDRYDELKAELTRLKAKNRDLENEINELKEKNRRYAAISEKIIGFAENLSVMMKES